MKGRGRGLWQRLGVELDKGSAQAFMSDMERALAAGGEKGARGLKRALEEALDLTLANLRKQLAEGVIDSKTFTKLKAEAESAFNNTLVKGMDDLKAKGKLTDAEFVKLSKSLKQVKQESDEAGKGFKGMMQGFVGGLAAFGAAKVTDLLTSAAYGVKNFLFSSSAAASEADDVVNRLAGTLERVGVKMSDVQGELDAGARAMQENTRFDDETYLGIIDALTEGTGSYTKAQRDAATVADLMAKKKMDLAAASLIVAKAINDPEMSLKKLGIAAREGETAIEAIRRTFRGAAEQDTKVFGGAIAQVTNAWGNFKEAAGKALNEMLMKSGILPRLTAYLNENSEELGEWWEQNQEGLKETAADLATVAEGLGKLARTSLPKFTVAVEFFSNLTEWYNSLPPFAKKALSAVAWAGGELTSPVRALTRSQRLSDAFDRSYGRETRRPQPMGRAEAAELDRLIDGALDPAPPAGGGAAQAPARMTEEQVQRYQALAQSRRLTADETRALRAEEQALREEVSKARPGSEEEVDARKRLADVEEALAGKKERAKKRERDADADEITRMGQIAERRALTSRETARLGSLQDRLTRSVESGTLSVEAEAKAQAKLADIRKALDAPREREIQMLRDIGQLRNLNASEIMKLSGREDELRAALSAKNLTLEREIYLRRQLAEVQGAIPAVDLTPATIIRPEMGPRLTLLSRGEERDTTEMRQQLALLAEISGWRSLSRDELAAAADLESQIERKLSNQSLSMRERLDLERDLAEAREANASLFTMDNVWESMVEASGAAGEMIAESWTDVFERVFEGGMNLRDFMNGMWDGVAGGLGKAIKAEAGIRAKKAGVHALEAAATGTLALAKHDYTAATKAYNAIPKFIAEAAGWAALGGAAGALQHESGGGSAGHQRLDRGGADSGLEAARRAESHIYVRNTINVNPFDPDSPRVQEVVQRTARNIVDSQGPDAFTRGSAPQ